MALLFPIRGSKLETRSPMIRLQFIFRLPTMAPNTWLPIVIVNVLGLYGYRIGIKNSSRR